jgi:hypothetical protein
MHQRYRIVTSVRARSLQLFLVMANKSCARNAVCVACRLSLVSLHGFLLVQHDPIKVQTDRPTNPLDDYARTTHRPSTKHTAPDQPVHSETTHTPARQPRHQTKRRERAGDVFLVVGDLGVESGARGEDHAE